MDQIEKQHHWTRLKFGQKKGKTKCRICNVAMVANIQHIYGCSACNFHVHRKCLLQKHIIQPCTDVTLREIEERIVFSGQIKIISIQTPSKRISSSLCSAKSMLAVMTGSSVIYFFKSNTDSKAYSSLNIFESKIDPDTSTHITLNSPSANGPFIFKAKKEEEQNGWVCALRTLNHPRHLTRMRTNLWFDHYLTENESKFFNYLSVKVIDAKNIPAMDLSGTSDAYCLISCEHSYDRTATMRNTLTPVWNETFEYYIEDIETANITINMLDEDLLKTDDPIGMISLPVKYLTAQPTLSSFELEKIIGEVVTGDILLSFIRGKGELRVKVKECRNLIGADPNGKSDPFVKLELQDQKFKTKIHKRTLNPVFNEEFCLTIDSNASTILTIQVHDWDLLVNNDFLGQLEVDVSTLPLFREVEKYYLLQSRISDSDIISRRQQSNSDLGSIRLETSLLRHFVHPLPIYKPLLDLLLRDYATVCYVGSHVKKLSVFSVCLITIFDVNSKAVELIAELTNFAIQQDPNPNIIFRGTTLITRAMDAFLRLTGKRYLSSVLQMNLFDLNKAHRTRSYEIDPSRAKKKENVEKNSIKLQLICQRLLDRIFTSTNQCPDAMKVIFWRIRSQVESIPENVLQSEQIEELRYTSITAFLFLRFFVPAITTPPLFGFVDKQSAETKRTCMLIAKLIQNLANFVKVGGKEDFMSRFEPFFKYNLPRLKVFIDEICSEGERLQSKTFKIFDTIWLEKELAMAALSLDASRSSWISDDKSVQELAGILDEIGALDNQNEDLFHYFSHA